jgi:hypothetical protein
MAVGGIIPVGETACILFGIKTAASEPHLTHPGVPAFDQPLLAPGRFLPSDCFIRGRIHCMRGVDPIVSLKTRLQCMHKRALIGPAHLFRPRFVTMITGRPVSLNVNPSVPPLPSYSSTCSATHPLGLGMYSLMVTSLAFSLLSQTFGLLHRPGLAPCRVHHGDASALLGSADS